MPAPLQHSDLSTFMGSWPVIPEVISGTPVFDTRVLDSGAVILGVKREPSAGFTLNGKSLYIWVDGTQHQVSFTGADPFTLDEVIDVFNNGGGKGTIAPAPASDIAFRDNGFLRFKSIAVGEAGTLRLQTDTDPDIFFELGLFSEIEAIGGQIKQTQHFDPDRQVALPGQVSMGDGETFRADVINRALYQLAANTERNEGLLSRKRMAIQEKIDVGAWPGASTGYQFVGDEVVYTGAATIPDVGDLESYFVVLDGDGKEYVKKYQDVLTTSSMTFSNAGGRQLVTDAGTNFVGSDEKDEVYVISSDGSLPAALQDVPMKILEVELGGVAVLQPIDPVTGNTVLFTTGSVSADRVRIETRRCVVDEVRVSSGGARVEGVKTTKESGTPTRIDKNNRIVISGALFVSGATPVAIGDFVAWASYIGSDPYTNNGNYRVNKIVDEETIEVVAEDWGPVYLNPDLSGGAGTVTVSTDGEFYKEPFLHFLPEASGGAIPETGDTVRIVYLGMSNFRTITDDPSSFSGGSVRYKQEADDSTQQAILAIVGPSATTIAEYLHDDGRNSLENIDYRLNYEHYTHDDTDAATGDTARAGRHRDIRPDRIDMWGDTSDGISGETVTIRGDTGEVLQEKFTYRDVDDEIRMAIKADGSIYLSNSAGASPTSIIELDPNAGTLTIAQDETTGGSVGAVLSTRDSGSIAQLNLLTAGGASSHGASLIMGVKMPPSSNPLKYEWAVDGSLGLVLDIVDDGAGGGPDNSVFVIDAAGRASIGTGVAPTGASQLEVLGKDHTSTPEIGIQGTGGESTTSGDGATGVKGVGGDGFTTGGAGLHGVGGEKGAGGDGYGVLGQGGGTTSGTGVRGEGTGTGAGLVGVGGSNVGHGVVGSATGGGRGVFGTGDAAGYGVYGVGGATQADGIRGLGGGTSGIGVHGIGAGEGYGVKAEADTSSPVRSALYIVPQNTDPTSDDPGAMYVHTNEVQYQRPRMDCGPYTAEYGHSRFVMQSGTLDEAAPYSKVTEDDTEIPDSDFTIFPGSLIAGTTIRVRAWGRIDAIDGSPPQARFRLKLWTNSAWVTLANTAYVVMAANQVWMFEGVIHLEAVGASATATTNFLGRLGVDEGALNHTRMSQQRASADFTMDTTTSQKLSVFYDQTATGSTNNVVVFEGMVVDIQ